MTERKRTPCNRVCDCEWGSKMCIQKRGYIWNYELNRWSRDENGNIHRTAPEHRECDLKVGDTICCYNLGDVRQVLKELKEQGYLASAQIVCIVRIESVPRR